MVAKEIMALKGTENVLVLIYVWHLIWQLFQVRISVQSKRIAEIEAKENEKSKMKSAFKVRRSTLFIDAFYDAFHQRSCTF